MLNEFEHYHKGAAQNGDIQFFMQHANEYLSLPEAELDAVAQIIIEHNHVLLMLHFYEKGYEFSALRISGESAIDYIAKNVTGWQNKTNNIETAILLLCVGSKWGYGQLNHKNELEYENSMSGYARNYERVVNSLTASNTRNKSQEFLKQLLSYTVENNLKKSLKAILTFQNPPKSTIVAKDSIMQVVYTDGRTTKSSGTIRNDRSSINRQVTNDSAAMHIHQQQLVASLTADMMAPSRPVISEQLSITPERIAEEEQRIKQNTEIAFHNKLKSDRVFTPFIDDVNFKNTSGNTLLHEAARLGHKEICECLIKELDANPLEPNADNITPAAFARNQGSSNKQLAETLRYLTSISGEKLDLTPVTPIIQAPLSKITKLVIVRVKMMCSKNDLAGLSKIISDFNESDIQKLTTDITTDKNSADKYLALLAQYNEQQSVTLKNS